MSACCRRPMLGLDIAAVREGAALALAPVLAKKKRGRRAGRARRRARRGARREQRQEHQRADGLCRPARALHALVRAALGREPRQGRQGHDAGRARSGRSTSTARCNCSSAGRATSCSPSSPSSRRGRGPRIDARTRQACRRAGFRRQDHRRSRRGRRPRHRRDAGQERLPGAHASICRGSTRRASANC